MLFPARIDEAEGSHLQFGGTPSGNCPAGINPTRGALGRAFQVPDVIDPSLVEDAATFRHIVGGDNHPSKIDNRDGALSEAARTAVDAKAALRCRTKNAGRPVPLRAL
jgi:hypothetical protein